MGIATQPANMKQPVIVTRAAKNISAQLDAHLKEVAESWRSYKRLHDRDTATLLVQLALSAIPRGSGRIAEWLGPAYFDEELPITAGSEVRILRHDDSASFRNGYRYSKILNATVNVVGNNYAEVTVRERFGLKVVITNRAGEEQVLQCGQLRRCEHNPHRDRDDPSVSAKYHAYNRKNAERVQVGTIVEYLCVDEWVSARVERLIRGANYENVVYTVAKERLINVASVKLSPRTVRRARQHNKLW